jgi:hypothetical protein
MTAKERADALQDALLWAEISGVDPRDKYAVLARQAAVIEKAFREAENTAIERSAEVAAGTEGWGNCDCGVFAARRIRSLKSRPEGKEGEGA